MFPKNTARAGPVARGTNWSDFRAALPPAERCFFVKPNVGPNGKHGRAGRCHPVFRETIGARPAVGFYAQSRSAGGSGPAGAGPAKTFQALAGQRLRNFAKLPSRQAAVRSFRREGSEAFGSENGRFSWPEDRARNNQNDFRSTELQGRDDAPRPYAAPLRSLLGVETAAAQSR